MYYNNYVTNRWQQPNQMVMPQNMQQMMQQQFPQMPQQQQQVLGLKGRLVSSIDEVRATLVDMDGSETYFPHPASNSIYTKSIDMNGNQVIRRYVLDNNSDNTVDDSFSELEKRVKSLEDMLESLTGGGKEK